jgi:hypothetical protein
MPNLITSKDFNVHNADAATVAKLDMALAYLQQSPTGTAIVREAVAAGVNLGINEYHTDYYGDTADPGQDKFDAGTNMVIWNPDSALQIKDMGGTILGVQSAALGLGHELTHSIDPAVLDHMAQEWKLPGYQNATEYTAITYESMMANDVGEVSRDNWRGTDIRAENPTTHTMPTDDGGLVWAQMNENGEEEYGSTYDHSPTNPPDSECPRFGSTDPGGNYHDGDDSGNGNGNLPGGTNGGGDSSNTGNDNGADTGGGGGGESDPGCVAISSFLPDGQLAGGIKVGDTMILADQETLEGGSGRVSYSQVKEAHGYRIITETGASLVCSETAPIPVRDKGLLTPDKLLGEEVAVRWDERGQSLASWEKVTKVEEVGLIKVQHITVGDRCFWAGEKKGAYILHHNLKNGPQGGDDEPEYDPLTAGTGNNHSTTGAPPGQSLTAGNQAAGHDLQFLGAQNAAQHTATLPADHAVVVHDAAVIVGVAPPVIDYVMLL